MKNKFFVIALACALIVPMESSFAAFGSRAKSSSGFGVSRSISRSAPKSTTNSYKPKAQTSYSKPYSSYSKPKTYSQSSNYYNRGYSSGYNNGYPQQRSTMGDIGIGVASVAGGILAAEAIQNLIAGPNGMYTHPQYPGQYFNAQGAPVAAPQTQAQPVVSGSEVGAPQGSPYDAGQQYTQQQQPVVVVQQPTEKPMGFFSFLWSALGNILHLILFLGVVGALVFGGWKLWQFGKKKYKEEKQNMLFDEEAEFNDLDSNAQEIFYNFQQNSNDKSWVKNNTKYLNVDDCLNEPSSVIQYQHETLDCTFEQGKLRASVKYIATLQNSETEKIRQIWNFEKDCGIWKLIGVESV